MMIIRKASPLTGIIHEREMDINPSTYYAYQDGYDDRFVQEIFPNLSADDREFLISGITPEEWAAAFSDI